MKPRNRSRTAGPAQQFNYIVEEEEKVHYVEVKLDSSFVKVEIKEVDDNGDEIDGYCGLEENGDEEVVYDTYQVVEEEEDEVESDEEGEVYDEEYEESEEEEEYILTIHNNRCSKEADLGIILEDDEEEENEVDPVSSINSATIEEDVEDVEEEAESESEEEEEEEAETDEEETYSDDDFNMETLHSDEIYKPSKLEEKRKVEDSKELEPKDVLVTKFIVNNNKIETEEEEDENKEEDDESEEDIVEARSDEEEGENDEEEDEEEEEEIIPATITTLTKPHRANNLIKPTLIFDNENASPVELSLKNSFNAKTRKQYSFDEDCDRPSSATPRLFNLYNIDPSEYRYRSKLPLSNDNSDVDIYYDFSEGPSSKLNSSENISEPLARHDMFLDSASSFNSRSSSMDQFSSSFDQMPLSSRPSFEDTDSDLSFNYRDTVNEVDRRNGYLTKQPSMTNIGLRSDTKAETKISVRDKISAFNKYSISKIPKEDVEKREPMKKILFNNADTARFKIIPQAKDAVTTPKGVISSIPNGDNKTQVPSKLKNMFENNDYQNSLQTTTPTIELNILSDKTKHLPTNCSEDIDNNTTEIIPEDQDIQEESHIEEEVKSPRARRFAKYQRAKTHSRLFKLLQ